MQSSTVQDTPVQHLAVLQRYRNGETNWARIARALNVGKVQVRAVLRAAGLVP
jgi:hypothetical protein